MRSTTLFERMIEVGKKKAIASNQKSFYLDNDLERFSDYIRTLKNKHPEATDEEMSQIVIDDFYYNLATKIFDANFAFENYMDLCSCKYLQHNHKKFNEIYETVSQPGFTPQARETFEDYLVSYVHGCIYDCEDEIYDEVTEYFDNHLLSIANDPTLSPENKYKQIETYAKRNVSNSLILKRILNGAKTVCFGPAYYLKTSQTDIEKDLRANLQKSILSLTSALKDTGAYQTYEKVNHRNFSFLGLPSFQYEPVQNDSIYVDLQASPGYLTGLSIEDLVVLNSYWLNRYTKELNAYADCLAIIHELSLVPSILDRTCTSASTIPEETLTSISEKRYCLFPLINNYVVKMQTEINNDTVDPSLIINSPNDDNFVQFTYEPLKQLVRENTFPQEYKDYFDKALPSSPNDPAEDIEYHSKLFNPSIIAYMQKSCYLSALIANLENKELKNAGVIPEKISKDGTHMNFSRFVGLGIDANLTFPVRAHLRVDFLRDFLKSYTGKTIVPVYEGIEDFCFPGTNQFASAQLVLPFSTKQQDLLKKKMKATKESDKVPLRNRNFVSHLYYLSNPSQRLPEHLLTPVTNSKGKVKNEFIRRYVDLEDGQLYLKINGELEKIPPIAFEKEHKPSQAKTKAFNYICETQENARKSQKVSSTQYSKEQLSNPPKDFRMKGDKTDYDR